MRAIDELQSAAQARETEDRNSDLFSVSNLRRLSNVALIALLSGCISPSSSVQPEKSATKEAQTTLSYNPVGTFKWDEEGALKVVSYSVTCNSKVPVSFEIHALDESPSGETVYRQSFPNSGDCSFKMTLDYPLDESITLASAVNLETGEEISDNEINGSKTVKNPSPELANSMKW